MKKKYYVPSIVTRRDTNTKIFPQGISEYDSTTLLLENVGDAVFWWRAKKKRVAWVTRVSRSSWPELESHETRPRFSPLTPRRSLCLFSENNLVCLVWRHRPSESTTVRLELFIRPFYRFDERAINSPLRNLDSHKHNHSLINSPINCIMINAQWILIYLFPVICNF